MESNSNNRGDGLTVGLTSIFVLFLGIILSATFMGVFNGYEPYKQLTAAMLSVAATGVITALLLHFQRKQQEELNERQRDFQKQQEKDQEVFQVELLSNQQNFEAEQRKKEKERLKETKVFEERLRIYQEFLKKLCDVVKDQKIKPEEEIELQFQVAYITMHTSANAINTISQQVRDIVVRIKNQDKDRRLLLNQLFDIADTFREELYINNEVETKTEVISEDDENNKTQSREQAIENFSAIVESDVKKFEKVLELKERTRRLKRMVNNNGALQKIYNGTILFHEYFTSRDNKHYVDSNEKIVIDLMPEEDNNQYAVLLSTRQKDIDKTKELVKGIWPNEEYHPWSAKDSHAHVHETISFNESDEVIKD